MPQTLDARLTRSRDRIIVTLVNLAKHFGVVKEVAVELVDTLEHGVDTGHGKGPWDPGPHRRCRQTLGIGLWSISGTSQCHLMVRSSSPQ